MRVCASPHIRPVLVFDVVLSTDTGIGSSSASTSASVKHGAEYLRSVRFHCRWFIASGMRMRAHNLGTIRLVFSWDLVLNAGTGSSAPAHVR